MPEAPEDGPVGPELGPAYLGLIETGGRSIEVGPDATELSVREANVGAEASARDGISRDGAEAAELGAVRGPAAGADWIGATCTGAPEPPELRLESLDRSDPGSDTAAAEPATDTKAATRQAEAKPGCIRRTRRTGPLRLGLCMCARVLAQGERPRSRPAPEYTGQITPGAPFQGGDHWCNRDT